MIVTDRTNVITVSQENLDWINKNVPGKSKKARLETILAVYKPIREEQLKQLAGVKGAKEIAAAAPAAGGA